MCGHAVHASESAAVASAFPYQEKTNVYACRINRGVKIHQVAKYLADENFSCEMVVSGLEIATNRIPNEDIVGFWNVAKKYSIDSDRSPFLASFKDFHWLVSPGKLKGEYVEQIKFISNKPVSVKWQGNAITFGAFFDATPKP